MHRLEKLENILEEDGIIFLAYGGVLTQSLIAEMTCALEREVENNELNRRDVGNIFTIFIELAQNMMNYSKMKPELYGDKKSKKGLVMVGTGEEGVNFFVMSRNLIDAKDKDKIEKRLEEIEGLDKEELRKLYKEKRKTGIDKHDKGAGIGFIEIAKRCDLIEHEFHKESDDRYYFTLKATIHGSKNQSSRGEQ